MQSHVRILGYLWLVFAGILIMLAFLFFIVISGSGLISGDRTAALITGGVGIFVAGLFAILSIPALLTGWGLLRFRPWARILAIILGVLHILNFPFGTALGVYTLWVLLDVETTALFSGRRSVPVSV